MIQDIYPHIYHNEYHPRKPKSTDYVFSYSNNQVLVKEDNSFFSYQDIPSDSECIYLFEIDDIAFYLSDLNATNHKLLPVKAMRTLEPKELAFACITGWQLFNWMNHNKYCGQCGKKTVQDTKERAMRCPNCGNIIYPKLCPAVIVGVINNKDEICVTHYASTFYTHDALIAGFAEIGETIEETVHREVKEETGLNVKNLRYYKSQPWSFSDTLLFGFFCEVDGDDTIHIDHNELKYGVWHNKKDAFDLNDDASLTSEMIRVFQNS